MVTTARRLTGCFIGGVLAASLAACGKDSTSPRATPTTAEAEQIGAQIADQVEQSVQSILPGDLTTPPFLSLRTARAFVSGPAIGRARLTDIGPGCPTITPGIPTDADSDGVPNTLSITYPNCVDVSGSSSITVAGGLSITDPTINVADLNYDLSLNNFRFTVVDSGVTVTLATNGTFSGTGSPTGASQSLNVTVVASATGQGTASFSEQWTNSFTPAQGDSLSQDAPLPAGTFSSSGSLSASHGNDAFAFSVQVVTPLAYDPACDLSDSPFQAGEIRANLTSGAAGGYIDVVWANCQAPTVTFVGQSTT